MSTSELIVVIAIAVVVMKPEDIKLVLQKLYNIKNYINKIKNNIWQDLGLDQNIASPLEDEAKELNFYLKKIIDADGNYDGDYSLNSIKDRYEKISARSESSSG
jgi:Protein of unknown function (DUF2672)